MLYYIKRFIKYLYIKIKWKGKVSFSFSSQIGVRSIFEGKNKIYPNTYFDGYMGRGSYIARDSNILGKIGRYTSIGARTYVIKGIHPYTYPFVSTSPMFVSLMKQNGYTYAQKQEIEEFKYAKDDYSVIIGNDCWIGENVSIISGVTIGDGGVILAGAVVTKDVPPYAIVGGIPAQVIRYRYNKEDIDYLSKFQWWNNDEEWIKEHADFFLEFDMFKKVANG